MVGLNPTQEDIDQFVAITHASQGDAARFLANGVTLEGAIEDYFATQAAGGHEEDDEDDLDAALAESAAATVAPAAGGARTLSGAAAEPLPAGWGQPSRNQFGTLGGMNAGDDDDEDEDDEARRRRLGNELYTGGERSGLAVHNPDQRGPGGGAGGSRGLVDDILQQARDAGPPEEAAPAAAVHQWGSGNTLGDDETPSQAVGGRPQRATRQHIPGAFGGDDDDDEMDDDDYDDEGDGDEQVERRLTFWSDGFSIEDGELYRYDNPANQELLTAIKSGRAPISLWNVRWNQSVQVVVEQRTNEKYTPPPKGPMKAFSGGGNRLGSATPGEGNGSASTSAAPVPAAAAATAPVAAAAPAAEIKLDPSQPSTSVQLRLGDGSRLVAKVNLSHTVSDLRAFILASRPADAARAFVLQTTFPSRELPDGETVEAAKLQNAVVVQRFT